MQTGILENVALLDFPLIRKKDILARYRFFLGAFWVFCVISIVSLFILCVFQINSEISARYSVSQYNSQLGRVMDENSVLETKSLNLSGANDIESLVAGLNFEKVTQINYIKSFDQKVVSK